MNSPTATYIAESKPYQLSVAKSCGFRVPTTLATNDARRIRRTFPGPLVVKSLDTVLLRDGDDCLFTYTTISSCDDLTEEAIRAVPFLAQHALEDKTDLRVTVIGEEVFAVQILSGGNGISGDWRVLPRSDLEFRDAELSDDTIRRCLLLVRQLGLSFGAIDLIETADGIFFIEINPTGEWGWLSTSDRPIDSAIAEWLQKSPEYSQ